MIGTPPACAIVGCSAIAVGRCAESHLPYCRVHLGGHSLLGSEHSVRLFPGRLMHFARCCPECHGPVRVTYGGTLVACRAREACGWMEVAA